MVLKAESNCTVQHQILFSSVEPMLTKIPSVRKTMPFAICSSFTSCPSFEINEMCSDCNKYCLPVRNGMYTIIRNVSKKKFNYYTSTAIISNSLMKISIIEIDEQFSILCILWHFIHSIFLGNSKRKIKQSFPFIPHSLV